MRRHPVPLLALLACALLALPATASAQVQAQVTNGYPVPADSYEWTVALVLDGGPPAYGYQFCGGTLIDADTVVTAAHCVAGMDPGTEPGYRFNGIEIVANEHDLTQATGDNDFIDVEQIFVMPGVDGVDPDDGAPVPRNDAAVLELASPVAPATTIPLVTPTTDDSLWDPHDPLEVSGWGLNEDGNSLADMNHATIYRWEDQACDDAYDDAEDGAPPGESLFRPVDMLCALDEDPPGTAVDSCNGDSGGPLTTYHANARDANGRKLVGIVSWGSPSCLDPAEGGVYTRVGTTAVHTFITSVRDDVGNPKPQPHHVSGVPTITGTQRVGETVTCARSGEETFSLQADDTEDAPSEVDLRLRAYVDGEGWQTIARSGWTDYATPPGPVEYALTDAEAGTVLACDLYARVTHHPGYAVANFYGPANVVEPRPSTGGDTTTTPPPTTTVIPPPAPPALPQPPVVAPRDEGAPRTIRVTRVCKRRRCSLRIFTRDTTTTGAFPSGVTALQVRLTSRYRCVKRAKRRTCIRRRTLPAQLTTTPGRFKATTPRLPRGLHTLRVTAIDAAGNREARALTYSFRLPRER